MPVVSKTRDHMEVNVPNNLARGLSTCLPDVDAVGTETLRYGQRVTVVALPAPDVLKTVKGLEHVGPGAFGYDVPFRSVFE